MAERTERDVLHYLIDICKGGERGFHAAADHVSEPTLKLVFTELATQRKRLADRLGGPADAKGTNACAHHPRWMVLKSLVPGDHDRHFVTEAGRGEHAALDAYEDALNGMLTPR